MLGSNCIQEGQPGSAVLYRTSPVYGIARDLAKDRSLRRMLNGGELAAIVGRDCDKASQLRPSGKKRFAADLDPNRGVSSYPGSHAVGAIIPDQAHRL